MLKRSFLVSKERAGKARKVSKRSFRDDCKQRLREHVLSQPVGSNPETSPSLGGDSPALNSAILTVAVGKDQRLFVVHEYVLVRSPRLADACNAQYLTPPERRRISLPDVVPEVFTLVLQYLYRGDYRPRLVLDPDRRVWSLDDADPTTSIISPLSDGDTTPLSTKKKFGGLDELATIYHRDVGNFILRDTAVYCAALRLRLPGLQRLALRKQGMQSGVDVATIMRSARFAYANTPDSDSPLRSYYLALIIRGRKTFLRSGTMQVEMELGGTQLFFDLFVALSYHIDDLSGIGQVPPVLLSYCQSRHQPLQFPAQHC